MRMFLALLALTVSTLVSASALAATGYGQITLENQSKIALDLFVRGTYGCRALGGLMCTSQELEGVNINLEARDMEGNILATRTVSRLGSGDSLTWTLAEEVIGQGAHPSPLVLTGTWTGRYYYPDGRPGVSFQIEFHESNGQLSGRTTEPNTFGDASISYLHAYITGVRNGQNVNFIKTYDGTGGQNHSVSYSGSLSSDGSRISGRWTIDQLSGQFEASR